ncbi:MAG: penicillin-binding protein 2 [Patescibacteria group bacterium]|nr:penicillin-binding protein 2 [Patescibacteria group bacterium]MBU1877096.1 penicillin-binding protein 2 [Patescibacteria group bacterium]
MNRFRLIVLSLFFFVFATYVTGKIAYIQIKKGDLYKALAQGLHALPEEKLIERGEILFKNNQPLAINKNWPLAWALPQEIKDVQATAQKLSSILNLEKGFLLDKFSQDKRYVILKNRLTQEETDLLNQYQLDGIHIDTERGRYYPQEALAGQIVGFLGGNGNGQYGLEEYYNQTIYKPEKEIGDSLLLTIDYEIQFMAEKLLTEAQESLKMKSGQIIVIDPNSGKILAMANFPTFNPNQYKESADSGDLDIFQNSLTQKIFEPGSVLKPITMAAALNEEKITPETTYVDTGVVEIGGWPIYNYAQRVYGEIPMTEVLEKSINSGAIFAERQIGDGVFLEYLEKFGFFEKTGIDLNEVFSENKELKKGYEVNFATASFGQGIEMTPIQLVRAYCALANGGKLIRPYIVEKIINNGEIIEEIQPKISDESILSSKASRQITAMLVNVIENGFAKQAKIPGYYIAGKSGTALIPWSSLGESKRGYSDQSWQSFIGWLPAFDPKAVILVKLDQPETNTSEYSAMPIFRKMAEFIVNYSQIPPDYE